jgi:hypothetical protein
MDAKMASDAAPMLSNDSMPLLGLAAPTMHLGEAR